MKSKKKKILFVILTLMATVISGLIACFVLDMAFTLSSYIKITDESFPKWTQKEINYIQKLTRVKLPPGTVLLTYSESHEGQRHDVSWRLFSKDKIIFPFPLTNDIMTLGWEIDAFTKHCRIRQANFSIEGDTQGCLTSFNTYDGKGHDVFTEIKTSKGYYVQIQYCRTLPRNFPEYKKYFQEPAN